MFTDIYSRNALLCLGVIGAHMAAIPNVKTQLIQDCGHMIMLEKSDQTLLALKAHLSST